MKKYLIASTALIMTAGAAAAELKLSGDARFGIQYSGAIAATPLTHTAKSAAAFGGGVKQFDAVTTAQSNAAFSARTNAVNARKAAEATVAAQREAQALAAAAGNAAAEAAAKAAADAAQATVDAQNVIIENNTFAGGAAAVGSRTRFEKRMTVNIDGSTTADNGVTFGARVRIRSDEGPRNGASNTAINGARVFVRAGGLTVAVGNINGAIESMPNLYAPSVGLTGLGWSGLVANTSMNSFAWDAYDSRGNGAEGVEAIYTMGDFTGHLSYSSDTLASTGVGNAKRVAAYGAYTISGWTVAVGVQDSNVNTEDKIILTASGKVGDFGIGFGAARNGSGATKVNKFAINGSYTVGATTLSGYVAAESGHVGVAVPLSKTTYGIGASYDMGGGARLVGGIERTTAKVTRADIGVAFSF